VRVALHRVLACLGDEVREQAEQLLLLVEEERGELLLVRELVPATEMWGDARRCWEIWRDIGRYRELVPLEDARGGAAVLAAALALGVELHLIPGWG